MNRARILGSVTLVASLPWVQLASAAEPDSGPSQPDRVDDDRSPGERDFHFQGGFGYSRDDALDGAAVHDLQASYRFQFIEAGVFGTFGTRLFGPRYASYGVLVGPVLQTREGMRAALLAQLGGDSYSSIDCELFCQSGGASATLPYAGGRVTLSYVFPAGARSHFELGVTGFAGSDLERKEVVYTTFGGLLSSGESAEQTTTLGSTRFGATLNAGLTVDL